MASPFASRDQRPADTHTQADERNMSEGTSEGRSRGRTEESSATSGFDAAVCGLEVGVDVDARSSTNVPPTLSFASPVPGFERGVVGVGVGVGGTVGGRQFNKTVSSVSQGGVAPGRESAFASAFASALDTGAQ